MIRKESRAKVRLNKHRKIRNRFSGTPECPRLAVFRSNNHMQKSLPELRRNLPHHSRSSQEGGDLRQMRNSTDPQR